MDAKNMGIKAIKEGISKGNYEVTGVIETGEVIIALVTDVDKVFIKEVLESSESNEEKLRVTKNIMKIKDRPAQELMQVYKQKCDLNYPRCKKNNLRIR
ncbi:hypothetical protein JJB52_08725 [Clostridium perfringens]|uniref:hypothetical protein n=1 Tax=Clostridium perfringens TaxID=1502 RepID=UPI001ABB9D53|nr:hypothetical protein [Clostridium perfringens]MBO3344349.1 hypothetical protein [Clostridium perfringens]MBO3347034.1 hypothetical protein [Clostridium perfringens]MBO3350090.1 hypothetical protein [Clostridium perfringens]MBO3370742.1 hypothetical protein [Clostridium perfringens]